MNRGKAAGVLIVSGLMLLLVARPADGQVWQTILLFAKAVEAASDAVRSVAETIEHIVLTVKKIPDSIGASREKAHLIGLRAKLTHLESQKLLVSVLLKEYVQQPSPERWMELRERLPHVLTNLRSVLEQLKEERSDFVLEDAFRVLQTSLEAKRNPILSELRGLPPPRSAEELDALRRLSANLDDEIRNIGRANEALAAYIKARYS